MSTNVNLDGSPYVIPADGDTYLWAQGATGLSAYLIALVASFNNRVKTSDIQDNLTSVGVANKPLSANQGYQLNQSKINTTDIVNDLVTNVSTKPLSAAMGFTLQNTKAVRGGVNSTPSGTVVLTITDAQYQFMVPTADSIVRLPTTSIIAGDIWELTNGASAFKITVQASDATVISVLPPKGRLALHSKIATPVTNADWAQDWCDGSFASGGLTTASFSASFGTVTGVQCFSKRQGSNLLMTGEFTMGTTTAAVGRITLPFGLSISTTSISSNVNRFKAGEMIQIVSSSGSISSNLYHVTSVPSSPTLLYFSNLVAAGVYSDFTMNAQGFDNQVFNFEMSIPISGWEFG